MMCLVIFATCIGLFHEFSLALPVLDENPLTEMQKRQHWTASLKPGGKRSFYPNENFGLSDDAVLEEEDVFKIPGYDYYREPVENMQTRQHWTTGLAPGGKRDLGVTENKRQHWTTGLSPGGKRDLDSGAPYLKVGPVVSGEPGSLFREDKQSYRGPSKNFKDNLHPSKHIVEYLEKLIRAVANEEILLDVSPFSVTHEEIASRVTPEGFQEAAALAEPSKNSLRHRGEPWQPNGSSLERRFF